MKLMEILGICLQKEDDQLETTVTTAQKIPKQTNNNEKLSEHMTTQYINKGTWWQNQNQT